MCRYANNRARNSVRVGQNGVEGNTREKHTVLEYRQRRVEKGGGGGRRVKVNWRTLGAVIIEASADRGAGGWFLLYCPGTR